LPWPKRQVGKDLETLLKRAKRIRRSATGLTTGSASALHGKTNKDKHQQAVKNNGNDSSSTSPSW